MRPDFGKCVIEKPRVGSSRPSEKARRYGKFVVDKEDGSLDYEGMTKLPCSRGDRVRRSDKEFTDSLGPLRGFLRNSCGRPWNDVFSEISQLLGKASWSLRHILTAHLDVSVNTYVSKTGHICHASKYGPQFIEPESSFRRYDYYVDPRTGILKPWPRKKAEPKLPSKTDLEYFREGEAAYTLENGQWFRSVYIPEPAVEIPPIHQDSRYAAYWRSQKRYYEPTFPNYRDGDTVYRLRRVKSLNGKEIKAMLKRRDAKLKQRYPAYK